MKKLLAMRLKLTWRAILAGPKAQVFGRLVLFPLGLLLFGFLFFVSVEVFPLMNDIENFGPALVLQVLAVLFSMFFVVLMFESIPTALYTLYLSTDIPFLMTAPLSRRKVFFLKYLENLAASSGTFFLFGLPILLGFGLTVAESPLYFIGLPLALLLFLSLPTSFGIIIALVVMRLFPAGRLKQIMGLLGGVAVMLIVFISNAANFQGHGAVRIETGLSRVK